MNSRSVRSLSSHLPRWGSMTIRSAAFGLVLGALTLVVPAPVAQAAGGGGHEAGGPIHILDILTNPEFVASVVNFTLLLAILIKFGRKPLNDYLVARRRQVEEGLLEAARLKEAAEKARAEYAERIKNLSLEMEKIRTEMVRAGEEERDRIVAEAERKAARMRREVEFVISQQMKQLRVDITREAVDAAVDAAEGVLKEKTTASDQQRIAQAYLEQLKESASRGAA